LSTEPPARITTLVVDDVPELRHLLGHVLDWSERFIVVAEAEDGRAAVQMAREHTPQLVLLDVSMPVMDGMEALPLILKASPDSKVVILSGFEAERLRGVALAQGAAAYIEKGLPPSELVRQILSAIQEDPGERPGASPPSPSPLTALSSEEMLSLVAHEIRNPLAVIQGFGNELKARWFTMADEQRLDAVTRMTERARYLNTVVSNLMYMRKVGSGEAPSANITEVDVGGMLTNMQEELCDLARGHPIELAIDEGLPAVRVDVPRMRQVLTNLVVNAAKFAPTGTAIRIGAQPDDGGVVIEVADEGPGIPEDKREVIFEKFARLEKGGSGIGLGLFISRELMSSMGGHLWADGGEAGAALRCRVPASH
jgi:signal transduction histidine kinase